MSGSAAGLASHAIFVGSFGAGFAAGGLLGAGAGAGAVGGGRDGLTSAGIRPPARPCAGITSGRASAGFQRNVEVTHCWTRTAPTPTTTAPTKGSASGCRSAGPW